MKRISWRDVKKKRILFLNIQQKLVSDDLLLEKAQGTLIL